MLQRCVSGQQPRDLVRVSWERKFVMRDGCEMQLCYRCGETKAAEEFAWRRKGRKQRDSFCRPCRALYKQEHYAGNRQRYIDRAGARTRRLRSERTAYLVDFFRTHPCIDCGETDPVVLEFDHRADKLFNIGSDLTNRKWEAVLDEMRKCDVVCANCHRRRTARRRGGMRLRLSTPRG